MQATKTTGVTQVIIQQRMAFNRATWSFKLRVPRLRRLRVLSKCQICSTYSPQPMLMILCRRLERRRLSNNWLPSWPSLSSPWNNRRINKGTWTRKECQRKRMRPRWESPPQQLLQMLQPSADLTASQSSSSEALSRSTSGHRSSSKDSWIEIEMIRRCLARHWKTAILSRRPSAPSARNKH